MRLFTALALATAASSVLADCVCDPSDNWSGSVSNNNNNNNNNHDNDWYDSPLYHPKPVKKVPKLPPTPENIQKGVDAAVKKLTEKNVLPPELAGTIQQAVEQAIQKQQQKPPVQVIVASASGSKTTVSVTQTPQPTTTVTAATTLTLDNGVTTTQYSTQVITQTQTITALPPGATILSNTTLAALDSIEDAINDAIAAVNLSTTNLDAAAKAELQTCLSAVLQNGGLPAGYSCISQSGSTSAGLKTTFNNILEQFIGILPAKVLDGIQDAVMPMLTGLLPGETTLLSNINAAIASVVSSLSGNSVTALEMMQSCYTMAIRQNSNTSYLQCYMSDNGPFETLQTGMNSVIQQFVGYLPPTVLESVQNLTASSIQAGAYPGVSGLGSNITAQLNSALKSVMSTLSGNSVTLMLQLQECANELLVHGNATAAENCLAKSPANTARTMVNGVAEQFSGYLPSAFFSDLATIVGNMGATGNYSKAQITTALDQAFNNANMGPAFVGCFEQVQACLLDEVRLSGDYSSVCPGPVKGCELIGSQNSTGLANTTLSSASSSASLPASTILPSSSVASLASSSTNATSTSSQTLPSGQAALAAAVAESTGPSSEAISTSAEATSSESAASSASESAVPSSSSSSEPAHASSSSSASSDAPASSSSSSSAEGEAPETASAADLASTPESTSAAATQRLARRSGPIKRSHAKLRMVYSNHYHKL